MKSFVLLCSIFLILLSKNASAVILTINEPLIGNWRNHAHLLNTQDSLRLTGRWGQFFPHGCNMGPCPPCQDWEFFDTLQFRNAVYIDMSDFNHSSFGFQHNDITHIFSFQNKAPNLRHIILPSHLHRLPVRAFARTALGAGLANLEVVEFKEIVNPDRLTEVPDSAFLNLPRLRRYDGLKYAEVIGIDAFRGVQGFGKIELPAVRHIKAGAFRNIHADSIIIGKDIEKIDERAFDIDEFAVVGLNTIRLNRSVRVFMPEITEMPQIFRCLLSVCDVLGSICPSWQNNINYYVPEHLVQEFRHAGFVNTNRNYFTRFYDANGEFIIRSVLRETAENRTDKGAVLSEFPANAYEYFWHDINGKRWDHEEPLSRDTSLFAKPVARWFDITYYSGLRNLNINNSHDLRSFIPVPEGNPEIFTVECEGILLSPPAEAREGHKFVGWERVLRRGFDNEQRDTITTEFTKIDIALVGNAELVAIWEPIEFPLNFHLNLPEEQLRDERGLPFSRLNISVELRAEMGNNSALIVIDSTDINVYTAEVVDRETRETLIEKAFSVLPDLLPNLEQSLFEGINALRWQYSISNISVPALSADGYEFGGWFDNAEFEEEPLENIQRVSSVWDIRTYYTAVDILGAHIGNITGERNIYARWIPIEYTLVFETNGGNALEDMTFTIESSDINLPIPQRPHSVFAGWFGSDGLCEDGKTLKTGNFGDKKLFARWTSAYYPIILNDTLGIFENGVYPFDEKNAFILPDAANLLPFGFSFGGWFDNERALGEPITEIPAGNYGEMEFWAKWTVNSSFIRERNNIDTRYGILLENAIVSDFARFSIITPEPAIANVRIFDNLGNVVWTANDVGAGFARPENRTNGDLGGQTPPLQNAVVWNLTNPNGRFVANGTYIIIAETTGISGRTYRYSARLGVRR